MATIRQTKKEIAYLVSEVISNSYMALYFQGESAKEPLIGVINDAAELHNEMIFRVNHPAEKHNPSLVKKHYRAIEEETMTRIDNLFAEISRICQA